MTLIMGQFTVTTSTVPIFQVPPGACSITMYNTTATNVWLGTSTAVTSTNGLVMHTIPTSFQNFMTSKGAQIYGFASAATSINIIIATDQ